jgi:serine/threonine-protein kinase RsbW
MLVRQVLTGIAEAIDLDTSDLYEISVAVTEACNNVVVHAYRGDEGPLDVEAYVRPGALQVVVRDRGVGIQPGAQEVAGTGLSVIQALSQSVELSAGQDGGTDIWMTFDTPRTRALDPPSAGRPELPAVEEFEPGTGIEITLAPTLLSRTILPRLLSVFAARAHFTTDRLLDGQLIADELAASAQRAAGRGYLNVSISLLRRDLELRIAPLPAGHAGRLLVDESVDRLGPVIRKLSTQHRVTTLDSGSHEMLALRLAQLT